MYDTLKWFIVIMLLVIIVIATAQFLGFRMPSCLRTDYKGMYGCKHDRAQTAETPPPVRSSSRLVTTSYTFIMKDGTTNVVDLTQVKEMTTNLDLVKEENHDN